LFPHTAQIFASNKERVTLRAVKFQTVFLAMNFLLLSEILLPQSKSYSTQWQTVALQSAIPSSATKRVQTSAAG
jgi:hypothetical protein